MNFDFRGDLMSDEEAEVMRYFGFSDIVCPADLKKTVTEADGGDLDIVINSDGGSLIAGTEMYSVLRAYGGKKTARIQSRAASAATVVMMACDKIIAESVSLICIHNPLGYAEGGADDMRHTAEELDNIKTAIINAYSPRMTVSRDEISELMDRDVWIDATAAKSYGLIDEIRGEGERVGNVVGADGKISANIVNSVGKYTRPTAEMIAAYRAAKEKSKLDESRVRAARAWLDTYRY